MQSVIKSRIERLEQELASLECVLLGQGYIVVIEDNAVMVDADNKCQMAPTPGQATRFTKEDAQRLGASMTNGNGSRGKAVHVRDAIKHDLEVCRGLLKGD